MINRVLPRIVPQTPRVAQGLDLGQARQHIPIDPRPPQEDHAGVARLSKEELHVVAGSYRIPSGPASEPGTGAPRRNPPADAQRRPDPRYQATEAQDQRRDPTARARSLETFR